MKKITCKKDHLPLVLVIVTLFLYSCEITIVGGTGSDSGSGGSTTPPANAPSRTFNAVNAATDRSYQLTADLFYEGAHCKVWVERGSNVSLNTARTMADTYDKGIYPKMIDNFNVTADGTNALEFADVDGDGKLAILLLNIKDSYKPGVNDSYVGGYFYPIDLLSSQNYPESNECDMICIDTYPQNPGSKDAYQTLAHEMQHLMNFSTSVLLRTPGNTVIEMDLWINEGLSSAAEWVYAGGNSNRVNWFQQDSSGLIKEGNNFFVWGNHESNMYALLDDYATVYLFFQYLRIQSSGSIYSKIISSPYSDFRAVTTAFRNNEDWGTLLKTWLAANYINASSGELGYKNNSEFRNMMAKTAPAGRTSVQLAPGEGVYSVTNAGASMPRQGSNVKYAGLNKSSPDLSDSRLFSGGALLTYNINTNTNGSSENGTTTGVAASVDTASGEEASRVAVRESAFSGPFRLDMGDMLRRNGHKESFAGLNPAQFSKTQGAGSGQGRVTRE